jgi:hypothetical protein
VPLETVHVPPTSNEVLQHGGATGGSFTFELNGSAVRKARKTLYSPLPMLWRLRHTTHATRPHHTAHARPHTTHDTRHTQACEELNARLAPLKEAMAGKAWKEVVQAALFSRVCLSSYGWHAVDFEDRKFLYYTWGTRLPTATLTTCGATSIATLTSMRRPRHGVC